jgi:hypothetical protein
MRILRLNNDLCELAEIGDELEDLQAELKAVRISFYQLNKTLALLAVGDFSRVMSAKNEPATALLEIFQKNKKFVHGSRIFGKALLCTINGTRTLVSLTDEDYEIAAKVLRSYGYVKGD